MFLENKELALMVLGDRITSVFLIHLSPS